VRQQTVSVTEARLLLAKQISEADFQRQVIASAKAAGWLVQHSRHAYNKSGRVSTPIQGHAGFPDLVLARERVLFVELKKVGAYPSPDQRVWHERLRAAGVEFYIWRPTDWPEIESVLS
jgi:VRR-NUC domain